MAHVIIFTDRSPETSSMDEVGWTNQLYTLPAGAYKVASHLRSQGYTVLVVPNCLSYTFAGLKEIISNNSRDLLWVGVSTTFLTTKTASVDDYRASWTRESNLILNQNPLYNKNIKSFQASKQLAWSEVELNLIGDWLKQAYNAPLLIGGAWVTTIKNGNLSNLNNNCFIVAGRAETFVESFTKQKANDVYATPEYVNNNSLYDDHFYKTSQMIWHAHDFIGKADWLPLEISRGCAFNCSFCDYDRKANFDNYKNPDTLLQELIRNYEQHGVTKYHLLDDLYNDSKEKVRELYDKVWSKLPFTPEWVSYMRLDMFWADPESADIIKASGAKLGSFGIETLHDRAGKKVGKGLGKTRILETLAMLKEKWGTDTLVSGLFIAGLPYEPRESIVETIEWAMSTDLLFNYHYTPLWITRPSHYEMVKKFNNISLHNNQYGVEWISDDNWVNTEGLTFEEVDQLSQMANSQKPSGVRAIQGQYPDFRTAGVTHDEYVRLKTEASLSYRILEANETKNKKIAARIQKVLDLKDI